MPGNEEQVRAALDYALACGPRLAVTRRVLAALDFETVKDAAVATVSAGLPGARHDHQVQVATQLAVDGPIVFGLRTIVLPGTVDEFAHATRDDLFTVADRLKAIPVLAGVLQVAAFAGSTPITLTIAWVPLPDRSIEPIALQNVILPWRLKQDEKPPPLEHSIDGHDILRVALAARGLAGIMATLLHIWPDEDKPIRHHGFTEARQALEKEITNFNKASEACGLAHVMPASVHDRTWRPHNLRNALEFGSIPATLRADLARLYGQPAAALFTRGMTLLAGQRVDDIDQDEIARLASTYLPVDTPEDTRQRQPSALEIFISYSWADKTRGARDLFEFLARHSHPAWMDEEVRPLTSSLDATIAMAMVRARAVILCFSQEMLTRGGYALRELLFAASVLSDRSVIARLDSTPIPETLKGLHAIDWFERTGPAALDAWLKTAVARPRPPDSPEPARDVTSLLVPAGGLSERLLQQVHPPAAGSRVFNGSRRDRDALVDLRADLLTTLLKIGRAREEQDWARVLAETRPLRKRKRLLSLTDRRADAEPTLFGLLVRLRMMRFTAQVQLGATTRDFVVLNRDAFSDLEELVGVDLNRLRPAPGFGWTGEDCRTTVRDCLDTFAMAEDWMRGFSPNVLERMCGVPHQQASTIEARLAAQLTRLADRMLALRLLEDGGGPDGEMTPWNHFWSSVRRSLLGRFDAPPDDSSPITTYFAALRPLIDDAAVARIAVRIADGIIEAFRGDGAWREETTVTHESVRIHVVLRSYRSARSVPDSLLSVHGTVLKDLTARNHESDLTLLISTFVSPDGVFGQFFNALPHPRPETTARGVTFMLAPVLMSQMLNPAELATFEARYNRSIYEEI